MPHRWAEQLQTLSEMGFSDEEKVSRALDQAGGNMEQALNLLF